MDFCFNTEALLGTPTHQIFLLLNHLTWSGIFKLTVVFHKHYIYKFVIIILDANGLKVHTNVVRYQLNMCVGR